MVSAAAVSMSSINSEMKLKQLYITLICSKKKLRALAYMHTLSACIGKYIKFKAILEVGWFSTAAEGLGSH